MKIFSAACLLLLSQTTAMAACTDVTAKVCKLSNYNPEAQSYSRPTCTTADANAAAVVQNAFMLASAMTGAVNASLKDEICALKNIFIVPDFSWGFYENPTRKPPPPGQQSATFVAIRDTLLTQTLAEIENGYLDNVLTNKK